MAIGPGGVEREKNWGGGEAAHHLEMSVRIMGLSKKGR